VIPVPAAKGSGLSRAAALSWAGAITLGLLLRVFWPEHRPIHHDEAVNWYLVGDVLRRGYYIYDPVNYHGPTFFYLSALGRALAPESLAALRLPSALVGALAVPAAWMFRKTLGSGVALALAWVLAVAPTWVFYSRQAIHETLLGVATLVTLALVLRFLAATPEARPRAAIYVGLGVGFMAATKETAILTFAAWGLAVIALRNAPGLKFPSWREVGLATAAGLGVATVVYSALGFDAMGVLRPVLSLGSWGQRAFEGGGQEQPWFMFAHLLLRIEAPLLLLSAFALGRSAAPLTRAIAVYFVSLLLMYSLLPYKTAWCAVQIVLPLALLAAQGIERILRSTQSVASRVGLGLAGAAVLALVLETSFLRYDERGLPLIHVQTHRELHHAMQDVLATLDDAPDARVRIFHPNRYPLNWYLRGRRFWREPTEPWPDTVDGDVLLASPRQRYELQERIQQPYQRRTLPFRDGVRLDLWRTGSSELDHRHEWTSEKPVLPFEPPVRPDNLSPGWILSFSEGRDPDAEPFLTERRQSVDLYYKDDRQKPRWAPLSMIWEAWLRLDVSGVYRFAILSDDGSRLWIDGRAVVRNWGFHAPIEVEAEVSLEPGWHHVQIQWFDLGGPARLRATWAAPGDTGLHPWPAARTWSRSEAGGP
jgi:uncharacterized protein (TIGR03663 family)